MLNRASRTLCGVVRRVVVTVQVNFRPRIEPATIRICVRMTSHYPVEGPCVKANQIDAEQGIVHRDHHAPI